MIIKLSLKLNRIDKSKIVTIENGQKFLDLILMGGRDVDKYGNDGFIKHDVTKEERESGVKGDIVGNWKFLARDDNGGGPKEKPHFPKPPKQEPEDETSPF